MSQIDDPANGDGMLQMDEDLMLIAYKNLYWTRLIRVEGFGSSGSIRAVGQEIVDDDHGYRWPIGADVVEECQAVATMPAVDPDSWAPLFDP